MINSYVCVDVETTGLNPKDEKLIEIGAVKVIEGQVVDCFQSFIQPGRRLSDRITELTGITDEMLADAPVAAEVMGQFKDFCGELPLMGHNLQFDYAFIKRAMVNEKLTFEKQGLDTLRIARQYLPELESRSLGFLCKHFQIEHTAHRALGDAEATSKLYQILCELFYEKAVSQGAKVFIPAPMNYSVKRDKPITIAQKEQITRYCAKLGITLNQDLNFMSRSEASRFIEKHRLAYKSIGMLVVVAAAALFLLAGNINKISAQAFEAQKGLQAGSNFLVPSARNILSVERFLEEQNVESLETLRKTEEAAAPVKWEGYGILTDTFDNLENNAFFDSLVYTGYNIEKHRLDGLMWHYVLASQKRGKGWLSDITYNGGSTGYETKDGAPDITFFEKNGLVCASYATYVYFNYLPNIAGVDTSELAQPVLAYNANDWYIAAKQWVEEGQAKTIDFEASLKGGFIDFSTEEEIPIGSIIAFCDAKNKSDYCSHIVIYAGYENDYHWVYHVGNENGPEFCAVQRMHFGPDPQWPIAVITTPDIVVEGLNKSECE